ncbi:MAG: hypothetical protein R3F42_07970 [Pseudomonadota bacterium]
MSDAPTTPTGWASAVKIMTDEIQTIFGAAVVILIFFGLSLVFLATGTGGLESEIRGDIIKLLIYSMVAILIGLVVLRIFKPSGLAGPPQPETEGVSFTNSTVE